MNRARSLRTTASAESDTDLLRRIRLGDEHALDQLMDRYWRELHAYLDHIVQNPDLTDDLVQETFVRIWARREQWRPDGSVRGLLCQIGRRLAFDDRRGRRRRTAWLATFRPAGSVPTPADLLDHSDLDRAVQAAIAALPERRRLAFLMARWEGLSHKEIAATLGISVQTVANQLTTALAELRTVLRPFHRPILELLGAIRPIVPFRSPVVSSLGIQCRPNLRGERKRERPHG